MKKRSKGWIMNKCAGWLGVLFIAVSASAQVVPQTITLAKGWNAFYLRVDPGVTANDFFAAWPVDHASLYDSASFLRTAQFATDSTVEPALAAAYLAWHRGLDDVSTLKNMAGDRIYVCFASNAYSTMVYGTPCVPRMSWHPASTGQSDTSLNFFGVSMANGATVFPAAYLNGLDTGYTSAQRVAGGDPAAMGLLDATSVRDGMVLAMDAAQISDWAGPLYLSPVGGIDFGADSSLAGFSVRNDASSNRTVSIAYARSQGPNPTIEPPLLELLYKTSSNTWETVPVSMSKSLAAGETWTLVLAIDRAQFGGVVGTKRAGILTVGDASGGSFFLARAPVSAMGGEGATLEKAEWPAGLWLVDMKMDQVSQVKSDTEIEDGVAAGGKMPLRAILHVDSNGDMTLLQRILIATTENTNGTTDVSLHLSDATVPAGSSVMRLSTVDMGVDNLQVAPDSGTFREQAQFSFTVAADDRSNPFRHAYHPDHDGLRWDFATPAPSGDDPSHYVGTVKPETFSVSNVLTFAWSDDAADIAVWDPDETLVGTCRWSLIGLRRQGALHVDGVFTMRRVSTVGALTP